MGATTRAATGAVLRNEGDVDVAEHNADLVILGGGSGGYACALRAAELGMSVVLVEKDKLGGAQGACVAARSAAEDHQVRVVLRHVDISLENALTRA